MAAGKQPWDRRQLLAAAGVRRDGEPIGAVVLAIDTMVAARDITNGWLWVAVGCLGLLILAVLVSRALTRWVLRPLNGLERAVAEMTEGVAGPPADVAGPPELRHFTSAFNTMAQVVPASLGRQQRLVADASHQMRNPLAAVRLRADTLEDYVAREGWPTYNSMTAELDRFENLQQLLRLARAEQVSGSRKVGISTTAAESTALTDVIEERVAFWQPILDGEEQQLRNRSDHPGTTMQLARHDVEQLLDVALENALRYAGHGATVTVSTEQAGETVELIVSDNGAGLPEEDLAIPMSGLSGYPYVVRRVPTCGYVPPGIRSIGVPDLLLCRQGIAADLVAAVVDVLATDARELVPPYVPGLQYLAPPSMIQTGLIPLNPDAVAAYRKLHG